MIALTKKKADVEGEEEISEYNEAQQ